MVIVKIELWPHGDKSKAKEIGRMELTNTIATTLSTKGEIGNYIVKLRHAGKFFGKSGYWKQGVLIGHRRRLSPYHLVLAALKAVL